MTWTVVFRWLTAEWGFLAFLLEALIGGAAGLWRFLRTVSIMMVGMFLASVFGGPRDAAFWIAAPFSVVLVCLFLWAVSLSRLLLFFPFPSCRNGRCRGISAYYWSLGTTYGRERWGVYRYRCCCGDEYIREGKRFFFVRPDGSKQPYMTLTDFRTWTPVERQEKRKEACPVRVER